MLRYADRVKETSATTGTGAISLGGALTGFQAFGSVCSNADTCDYMAQAVDGSGNLTGDWEVGLGTYTTSGNTLARTTVHASSNAGALVNFSAAAIQVAISSVALRAQSFTPSTNSATPNAIVPVATLTALNSATNVDIALTPKGTGALTAQAADNTTVGGAKRGTNAVDWQTTRASSSQVASSVSSVIGGGQNNTASGSSGCSTVSGGITNNAAASYATIGGGSSNGTSGTYTVIGGGSSNLINISSAYAVIGGGSGNTISGQGGTIAGGETNTTSAQDATIAGGANNTADGIYSCIPGGRYGRTRGVTGAFIFASGLNTTAGDAQAGKYILRGKTTSATPLVLTTDASAAGAANQVVLPNNATYTVTGKLTARNTSTGDSMSTSFVGALKRGANAAATAVIAAITPTAIATDTAAATWVVAVTADTTNGALSVTVTGVAATNISWVCEVATVEATN